MTYGDYDWESLPRNERAVDLAITLDKLSKVELLQHWSSENAMSVFMGAESDMQHAVCFLWATGLNAQVRRRRKQWNDRMLLWNRLSCHEENIQHARDAGEEVVALAITDAAKYLNFASECEFKSATSLVMATMEMLTSEFDRSQWWMSLVMSLSHAAHHAHDVEEMSRVVTAYQTAHPTPTALPDYEEDDDEPLGG